MTQFYAPPTESAHIEQSHKLFEQAFAYKKTVLL